MPIEPYLGDPVTISAVITTGLKARLLELGGGNLSAGLRLQMAQPTTTPSEAVWCSHPEQLPDPEAATAPSVIACPAGVVAHGVGAASLILDCEGGEILLLDGDDANAIVRPLSLANLADLAAALLPAVLAVVNPNCPPAARLPLGLCVQRLAPGIVAIGAGAVLVALPLRHALQLCAEVASLLARRLADRQVAIHGLERALAEPVEREAA